MKDLQEIKKKVELITGVDDISKKSKKEEYVKARALFYLIATKDATDSLSVIGRFVGKDHCAILNSFKKKEKYFKDKNFLGNYNRLEPENFNRKLTEAEEQIHQLRMRILELKEALRCKMRTGLKPTHGTLFEILNDIPEYHVETVRTRLEPIVRMLEKPSMHNYLPSRSA